jgi:flagellar basal-body rod modification protein FlgD
MSASGLTFNSKGQVVSSTAAASSSSSSSSSSTTGTSTLSSDQFMQLLLTEMQNQDPTSPMDSSQILQQTSELATLESANNTNTTLNTLASTLQSSQQFSTVNAIGKTASLGSDTITSDGSGTSQSFDMYFPSNVQSGYINITDASGNIVDTISVSSQDAGVYSYTWDGKDSSGEAAPSGAYHVDASYTDTSGNTQQTEKGLYPISAVKFDGSSTEVKLGSSYYPLSDVQEIF